MKWVIVLVAVFCINHAYGQQFKKFQHRGPPPGAPNPKAREPIYEWITQRVDHFNQSDSRTWEMRYLSNGQFFQEGGPIFIYAAGEWAIDPYWVTSGLMFDMAEEHNGYLFYTEHRYYGESHPTDDITTKNLQYLSAEQALLDLAYFIQHKKRTVPGLENSKVVIVGSSYSASLATWMRIKYPHLVDAAWASSAPLRAVADFYEYFEVVSHNLGLASTECVNIIREAVADIEGYLEYEAGIAYVSLLYNTCRPIKTTEPERAYFFSVLGDTFSKVVQAGSTTIGVIEQLCNQLESYPGNAIDQLAAYISYANNGDCLGDYATLVYWYNITEFTDDVSRQWHYQLCTEFGFVRTSTSPNQPFGQGTWGVPMFVQICKDLFGFGEDIMNAGIERTNLLYGSNQPQVTKVVTVHGTIDPWHAIGASEDINPMAPVIIINGTSHSTDLYSIGPNDFPELVDAKLRVKSLIAQWLNM